MEGVKSLSILYSRESGIESSGDWRFRAACRAAPDPDIFIYKSKRRQDIFDLERAQQYCGGCPVRAACYDASTVGDREYSIRGGKLPSLVSSPVRLKSPLADAEAARFMLEMGCCRGKTEVHLILSVKDLVIWKSETRCRKCVELYNERRKNARKAAREAASLADVNAMIDSWK